MVPAPTDVPGVALALAGRLMLRRPPMVATDLVSNEVPVIVAGMHRSGTSIFTEILASAGMYIGGSAADEHHESWHFSRANRAMLGEAAAMLYEFGWSAPKTRDFIEERRAYAERAVRELPGFFADRADERAWGWKDPRNSLTLDIWLSIFPNARVLHIVRDGRIVALSLADRDQLEPSFGLGLWAHYVEEAEQAMCGLPEEQRCTIRYEDLVREPTATVSRLLDFARIDAPVRAETRTLFSPERASARDADPRIDAIREHPALERFGYGRAVEAASPTFDS